MISNAISGLALLVSAIALFLSTRRAGYETQRTLRAQLNEVLRELSALGIEVQKVQYRGRTEPDYAAALAPAHNQQQVFLVQQAVYLAGQIPALVSSAEWTAMGYFSALSNDMLTGNSCYSRAVQVAPDAVKRLSAKTAYAWFLFTQRRFEEARAQYREGLAELTQNDNFARYQKGRTNMFWGQNERLFAKANTLAQTAFEAAASEFAGIDLDAVRESALKELEAAKQAPSTHPASQPPPPTPSHGPVGPAT